uniref:Uncharacterized protein n=1 Tax=Timema cristinae TaxID=61476 RepID=A0A7R9H931_TIMCR|nr:unnamed protein product [Timema cristinae]
MLKSLDELDLDHNLALMNPGHAVFFIDLLCYQFGMKVTFIIISKKSSKQVEHQDYIFRHVYRDESIFCLALREVVYQLGTDPYSNLYLPMRNYLDFTAATNCGKVRHIFLKKMQSYFQKPKKR